MAGTTEFLQALKMRESGGDYAIVNTLGYMGAYQFGEAALGDLGLVGSDGNDHDNVINGGWTGKYGIDSRAEFLASPAAQDQIALDWIQLLWRYIEYHDLAKYAWTTVGGVVLTPAGMTAAVHLLGCGALADWIASGGTSNIRDAYGTPLKEYIQLFSDYDLPWTPDAPGTAPTTTPPPAEAGLPGAILGTEGADQLGGTAGADVIRAGGGHDAVSLDAGNDDLDGGAGSDWLVGSGATRMTVDLALSGAQATGYGTDTISGFENLRGGSGADRLLGDGGANALEGQGGNDTLAGREGADRIVGGAGTDRLYGGVDQDRDVFVFNVVSDSRTGSKRDIVYDFASGTDVIDLSAIDANVRLEGDQDFAFSGTTAQAYSVWYVRSRGDVLVRADVNGDRVADMEVRLSKVAALGADDFLF